MKLPTALTLFVSLMAHPLIHSAETPVAGSSSEIRTPPAPATPRINGPTIFGVRPDAPFLYTIPVTGDRADHGAHLQGW